MSGEEIEIETGEQEISLERVLDLQKRQNIAQSRKYIKNIKIVIQLIEQIEAKAEKLDRLDYTYLVNQLLSIMAGSVNGWIAWSNLYNMQQTFTIEELREFYPKFKAIVKAWIDLDIEITKIKADESESKLKSKTPSRKHNNEKTRYVA